MKRFALVLWIALWAPGAAAQSGPPVSQLQPTTSAQLLGAMTDPTGTGSLVFGNSPTLILKSMSETATAPAITSNVLTIDLSAGTVFNVANNANISTFNIINAAASKASAFTLFLKANGTAYSQSWSPVLWANGIVPTLTTTNTKVDVLTFISNDGGTTWFGFIAGRNY